MQASRSDGRHCRVHALSVMKRRTPEPFTLPTPIADWRRRRARARPGARRGWATSERAYMYKGSKRGLKRCVRPHVGRRKMFPSRAFAWKEHLFESAVEITPPYLDLK